MQTESRLNVRYAETDQMGIVHHSNYPIWFEVGRTDFFIFAGLTYADMEALGIMLPLYEISCQFKSPAKYGDEVIVITKLDKITPVRICFSYEVIRASDSKQLAVGKTMHAWTDTALKPLNAKKLIPREFMLLTQSIE